MTAPITPAGFTLPHSKEDEKYVVGVMLRYPDEVDEILVKLNEDDFYWDCHQRIFRAAQKLQRQDQAVDMTSVFGVLSDSKDLENIGGAVYLAELWEVAYQTATVAWSIERVKAFSMRRQLIQACTDAIRDAHSARPMEEVLPELENRLQGIGSNKASSRIIPIAESLQRDFERIQQIRAGNTGDPPIPTGLLALDSVLSGGFRPGVTAIGARPGSGKTAIGKQICRHASKNLGIPSLFISLEMPEEQLTQRDMAGLMKMDIRHYRDGCANWTTNEDMLYDKMYQEYSASPAYNIDEGYMTVTILASILRRAIKKHGIKLMVIDYLTLLAPDHEVRHLSRREQVEHMTRQIKLMSRRHSIPIIQLCQLNRDGEEKPALRDFRDSGSIEQDADNCLMLWQKYNVKEDPIAHIGCHVAKQRNGMAGIEIDFKFYKPSATFYDWNNYD